MDAGNAILNTKSKTAAAIFSANNKQIGLSLQQWLREEFQKEARQIIHDWWIRVGGGGALWAI